MQDAPYAVMIAPGHAPATFTRVGVDALEELSDLLANQLQFFFADGRYRRGDARSSESLGNCLIELASATMMWRLVRDRGEIFLYCRRLKKTGKYGEWYSLDLLIWQATGERQAISELNDDGARWLEANLAEVEDRFSDSRLKATVAELQELERRMWKEDVLSLDTDP